MDRQLLERMIGAGVLMVVLVLVVPAILDSGQDDESGDGAVVASGSTATPEFDQPTRTHTMLLDQQPETPPVARETPEVVVAQPEQSAAPAEAKVSATVTPPPVEAKSEQSTKVAKPATKKESVTVTQSVEKANPKVATAAPPARQKAESVPTTGWAVQLGSFGDKQNAERLASVVSKKGFSTYLMSSQQAGKTLYRVRVGPRDSRAQATELAERLANAGYKGQVTQQLPDS